MSGFIIAIDGPSASGKSTVSRRAARILKCVYVDSGSLYRGLTWHLLGQKIPVSDNKALGAALCKMHIEFFLADGAVEFLIDGKKTGAELRSLMVNENVSRIAALPAIREWVVQKLRGMVSFGNLVIEGRDIGTAVFPEAQFKFYLDATPEERARRRHLEMLSIGQNATYDEILRSILKRDGIDSSRAVAPLKIAPDAVIIQSTKMSIDEVVNQIVKIINGSQ